MKKRIMLLIIVVLVGAGGFFFWHSNQKTTIEVPSIDEGVKNMMTSKPEDFLLTFGRSNEEIQNRRSLLKTFIQQKLMKDGNIITNYLPNEEQQNVATGHDLLSESAGLYLLDLAAKDTKGRFDVFYKRTVDTFYDGTQFSYRVTDKGVKYDVNASLDDLRIFRALIIAKANFDTTDYDEDIQDFTEKFIQHSTNDGLLIDFYDVKNDEKSQEISLFYLDYRTLSYLYQLHDIDAKYLQYQVNIAKNGYISDEFPLYHQRYSYKSEKYLDGDNINIIESLLTIRYLAEIGEADPNSLEFVKEHVAKGTLFNAYDLNGNPVDKNQSAASYAIAALIGYFTNDDELYTQALSVLENFQTMDATNVLYGGIGDPLTKEVYSFNNLMALLAYGF
ncbi:hypothetical protein I6N96_06325 [Enterococcus sp. BWM-S5]|uniref:Glycosyl hydrolase family 8 n=1 Tax=Enterococcus larvae TaxID=2794352 RepID=A0ABS4CH61_9ENTE|nr:hypothetical protein [Enterococcus larvae]MBP1045891.1 hypothetical protein [Enterococcus larvae]